MPPLLRLVLTASVLTAAGCDGEPSTLGIAEPDAPAAPPVAAAAFDPAASGTVRGRVTWAGPQPAAEEFLYGVAKPDGGGFDMRMMPNPNVPHVDPATRAVAGAVVFLRGIDPAAAKPWDLPAVRVEFRDRQIRVRQGDAAPGRVGFVRRGDGVSLSSAEPVYHVLRGRGASFFSLTFPDADRPLTRTLDKPGRVELTSGAGFYWASADLFVADHPYYSLTDRDGRFTMNHVPAGKAELVVWLPGWTPAAQERDPESGLVSRMNYAPPVEVARRTTVERGQTVDVSVAVP